MNLVVNYPNKEESMKRPTRTSATFDLAVEEPNNRYNLDITINNNSRAGWLAHRFRNSFWWRTNPKKHQLD